MPWEAQLLQLEVCKNAAAVAALDLEEAVTAPMLRQSETW